MITFLFYCLKTVIFTQNLIKYNPKSVSYRLYVGKNLENFPTYVKRWGDYYLWDYFFDDKVTHWSYPFAVDGTIYNTKGILEILKNLTYLLHRLTIHLRELM